MLVASTAFVPVYQSFSCTEEVPTAKSCPDGVLTSAEVRRWIACLKLLANGIANTAQYVVRLHLAQLTSAQHCWLIEGGDCATLHYTGAAPPEVMRAVLGTSIQKAHQTISVCSEERDQDGEGSQWQDF